MIHPSDNPDFGESALTALTAVSPSVRLRAALQLGTAPREEWADPLVARCAVEPDFHVRDMLTWALTRLPRATTTPRLLAELESPVAQARSQALHTLSKTQDDGTWTAITPALLCDGNDEVARSAWRAAVVLFPVQQRRALAGLLATQFARGGRDVQLSLSRALVALGSAIAEPVIHQAKASGDPAVRAHAVATEQLLLDPDSAFEPDLREAQRVYVLSPER